MRRPALELGGNRVAADTAGSGLQGFRPITIGRYRMTLLQLDPYPEPGKDPLAPTSTALIRVEPIRPETSTSGQSR